MRGRDPICLSKWYLGECRPRAMLESNYSRGRDRRAIPNSGSLLYTIRTVGCQPVVFPFDSLRRTDQLIGSDSLSVELEMRMTKTH